MSFAAETTNKKRGSVAAFFFVLNKTVTQDCLREYCGMFFGRKPWSEIRHNLCGRKRG